MYGTVVMASALMHGLELVVLERFTPAAALPAIAEHRVTIFDGAPPMYLGHLSSCSEAQPDTVHAPF